MESDRRMNYGAGGGGELWGLNQSRGGGEREEWRSDGRAQQKNWPVEG